jgi:hypothetical protein
VPSEVAKGGATVNASTLALHLDCTRTYISGVHLVRNSGPRYLNMPIKIVQGT